MINLNFPEIACGEMGPISMNWLIIQQKGPFIHFKPYDPQTALENKTRKETATFAYVLQSAGDMILNLLEKPELPASV